MGLAAEVSRGGKRIEIKGGLLVMSRWLVGGSVVLSCSMFGMPIGMVACSVGPSVNLCVVSGCSNTSLC